MLPLLAALALGTLVSEDLTCLSAGMLVASGDLPFAAALAACLVGILVGDWLMYAAGRWLGRPFLRRRPLRWLVREDTVDAAGAWLKRNAFAALLASRVLPGARMPTFVALGLADASDRTIARWYAVLTLVWTPILVISGAIAGQFLLDVLDKGQSGWIWLVLVPLAAVWVVGRIASAIFRRRADGTGDLQLAPPEDGDSRR
jgi:membrane protein DedA with SNARE-associated domain